MRNYNFIKPLWIIVIAFLVNIFVTNLLKLIGATPDTADSIGFIAMIIAALFTFNKLNKRKRKH